MAFATLPGLAVSWTQPSLAGGDTFVNYYVYRRLTSVGGTYTRIASVTPISQASYTDYNIVSGISYDYTVTIVVSRAAGTFESVQATAVANSVTFTSVFLHDVGAPSNYAEVPTTALTVKQLSARTFIQSWGRNQPTAQIGLMDAAQIQITGKFTTLSDQTWWAELLTLLGRERDHGAALCLRTGTTADKWFCQLDPATNLQRDDVPRAYHDTVSLQETYYLESV